MAQSSFLNYRASFHTWRRSADASWKVHAPGQCSVTCSWLAVGLPGIGDMVLLFRRSDK